MSMCTCVVCCEHRAAVDEDRACAELVDHTLALRARAYEDWRRSNDRLRAATLARDAAHGSAGAA